MLSVQKLKAMNFPEEIFKGGKFQETFLFCILDKSNPIVVEGDRDKDSYSQHIKNNMYSVGSKETVIKLVVLVNEHFHNKVFGIVDSDGENKNVKNVFKTSKHNLESEIMGGDDLSSILSKFELSDFSEFFRRVAYLGALRSMRKTKDVVASENYKKIPKVISKIGLPTEDFDGFLINNKIYHINKRIKGESNEYDKAAKEVFQLIFAQMKFTGKSSSIDVFYKSEARNSINFANFCKFVNENVNKTK